MQIHNLKDGENKFRVLQTTEEGFIQLSVAGVKNRLAEVYLGVDETGKLKVVVSNEQGISEFVKLYGEVSK